VLAGQSDVPGRGSNAHFEADSGFVPWIFNSNLPVDSAIFLEFLPGSHQYLLVVRRFAPLRISQFA
jgi:hypothetical protein